MTEYIHCTALVTAPAYYRVDSIYALLMDLVPRPKRWKSGLRPDQRICPHCNKVLSYKTFNTHKRLHYNNETNTWNQDRSLDIVDSMEEESPPSSPKESEEKEGHSNPDLHMQSSASASASVIVHPEDPPLSDPGSLATDSEHHTSDGKLTYFLVVHKLIKTS